MTDSIYQQRYWQELTQIKAQVEYLRLYQVESELNDNRLKKYLAITSSGSIAAWAVWSELQILWAVLVAGSQVLNAIKRYLPWEKRAKTIAELSFELEELLLFGERKWFEVAEGELTPHQIHEQTMDIKQRKSRMLAKHMKNGLLPDNTQYMEEAAESAQEYFSTYYSPTHQSHERREQEEADYAEPRS